MMCHLCSKKNLSLENAKNTFQAFLLQLSRHSSEIKNIYIDQAEYTKGLCKQIFQNTLNWNHSLAPLNQY